MFFKALTKEERSKANKIKKQMETNQDGSPRNVPSNYVLVWQNDPRVKGAIRLNELDGRNYIVADLGWKRKITDPMDDNDLHHIRLMLQQDYGLFNEKEVESAVDMMAHQNAFHPIRDLLESICWDGTPRIENLLHHFLGAEISPFNNACMTLWMLGAISRVFEPGCKFDYVLCLIGDQGAGKSSFFRKMAMRDEWFTDDLKRLDDPLIYRQISGHWIIELPEMSAMYNTRYVEDVKALLSRKADTYKIPYAHFPKDFLRQCVFGGTGNRIEFLPTDRSGNRRFLPILIDSKNAETHILTDEAQSEEYIRQCWAEAMVLYHAGNFKLMLPKEIEDQLRDVQQLFTPEDDESGVIIGFLERTEHRAVCSRMIFTEAFQDDRQPTRAQLRSIAEATAHVISEGLVDCWEKASNKIDFGYPYGRQRGWIRIMKDPSTETLTVVQLPLDVFNDDVVSSPVDPPK